jgi:hypothetical protein
MDEITEQSLIDFSNNLYEALKKSDFEKNTLYISNELYNILLKLDLINKIKNKKLLKNIIIDYNKKLIDLSFDYKDNEKILSNIFDLY